VGQTLLDFLPEGVKRGLDRLDALKPILITPEVDATGGDTVVGPNRTNGWESASILDLMFEYDPPGSHLRSIFNQSILAPMKSGMTNLTHFNRTKKDGSEEHLVIAFAPVYERVLLPTSPDDFARGANVSEVFLYAVGIIHEEAVMHAPFHEIEGDVESQLATTRTIYIILTAVVAFLFTAFTCIVSWSFFLGLREVFSRSH